MSKIDMAKITKFKLAIADIVEASLFAILVEKEHALSHLTFPPTVYCQFQADLLLSWVGGWVGKGRTYYSGLTLSSGIFVSEFQ